MTRKQAIEVYGEDIGKYFPEKDTRSDFQKKFDNRVEFINRYGYDPEKEIKEKSIYEILDEDPIFVEAREKRKQEEQRHIDNEKEYQRLQKKLENLAKYKVETIEKFGQESWDKYSASKHSDEVTAILIEMMKCD